MRVQMISLECGPGGSFQPGDERDVSDEQGRQLVSGRHAVDISPRRTIELQRIEVADMPESERAMLRGKKGRGR